MNDPLTPEKLLQAIREKSGLDPNDPGLVHCKNACAALQERQKDQTRSI